MDRNYYAEYYELERNHWWFRARQQIIRTQIRRAAQGRTDLRILNIGAATGASSIMLEEFGTVKSIEFDRECYDFVKANVPIDIDHGSVLGLTFPDNSFDLVCAFDVIEHVEDDAKAVSEMQRVCAAKGHVVVTVPALMMLWSRHDEVNHHFRRYTLGQLRGLFTGKGIIHFSSYFNTFLFLPVFLVRAVGKLFPNLFNRKGAGSDFGLMKNSPLDSLWYRLMLAENSFLKRAISFPVGVSIILSWSKE